MSVCGVLRAVDDSTMEELAGDLVFAGIFKKGDPTICGNYRPICFLAIGYKLFASILSKRLQDAGAAQRSLVLVRVMVQLRQYLLPGV